MKILSLLFVLFIQNVAAQDSITLELGNDLLTEARTDRYLTNTFLVKIETDKVPSLIRRFLPDIEADHFLMSVGNDMYTPEDIEAVMPDPYDRPYAGHSYIEFKVVQDTQRRVNQTWLTLSVVGPAALSEELQSTVHDWTGSTNPQGWDSQLENELGVQIGKLWGYKNELYRLGDIRVENITYATGTLGNINTSASVGSKLIVGLKDEKNSKWGAYLETDIRQTYVARDIFIDGNSAWFGEPTRLERKEYVTQWDTSLVGRYGNWYLRYTYTYQTEQFKGQNGPTKFGRISLEYTTTTEAIGKMFSNMYQRFSN
ncbi:MAG: lipid A deacylase LpxR family protein [Bacteriovoracaceae bacterium]|jgi:hypothetical protein|nr:hypothetical protein [Halobacteriovoraceae bacterium]MDP7320785.1 lipid A deacylase LpxR family protein [Bacteriovoracaceae bacterium]|tara:strand:+ start:69 stop:1010 length:942 start_codon:yes stop_codon:yes gene_type:complete